MKSFRYITMIAAVFAVFSCKHYEPVSMELKPLDMNIVTHSIQDLIAEFGTEKGVLFPVRPNSGDDGLFSVDTIPQDTTDIIIAGRVISDDSQGNFYKAIAIQDLTNPLHSIKISIDASGIGAWYPLGSIVSIRCNGLAIGKYADMIQLGTVYFNNNSNAAKKGYEPGRIPLPLFQVRAKVHSLPELDKIVVDTMTIAEILSAATDRTLHSRLVCIKNVHFNQKSQGKNIPNKDEPDKTFAPSTNGVGFPRSRDIEDGSGGYVSIATSEYARFCNVLIPTEEYVGTVTAIVAWYRDKSQYNGNVQLTIRFLEDLDLYSTIDGSKWEP